MVKRRLIGEKGGEVGWYRFGRGPADESCGVELAHERGV